MAERQIFTDKKSLIRVDAEQHEYTRNVVLLKDRLDTMSRNLESRAQDVFVEYMGKPLEVAERLSIDYRRLAHFTGLLGKSVDKLAAEISETGVSFGQSAPLDATLKTYLQKGMDKKLLHEIREIAGNFDDGDRANFIAQVKQYTGALRSAYRIPEPSKGNSPAD